ncbi:MAG: hypothetical protein IPF69_10500 [Chitinophagaceae bacterium]|nr:hypothetical protein [Chitinophagaceae bacterium]MBK7679415.1 hypothetical protein [Chitinophagaceae bacterium]MBK8299237.1 hypothetical protein [Chitinophagaceae bacterium]MBK9463290.1 hypothetical protein [Chitinophagaceae bacterium]MBK9659583.1 hypothetical protein [Chitinophagaceae bacterium]
MKPVFFFASIFTITTVISCGSKSDEAKTDTPAVSSPASTNIVPQTNTLPQVNTPAISTPVTIPTTTQSTTAAGLNPAHGQPGHRCDISVGAPLNSAPATTKTAAVTQQPVSVSTPQISLPQTQATTVAPGMNPAHGQPGHRCDISVGAPLNSAPAKPAITTTPTK